MSTDFERRDGTMHETSERCAYDGVCRQPLDPVQVRLYLDRIGLPDVSTCPECTLELLDRLIFAHQCAVPFESVDFAGGGPAPSLELEQLFRKVVVDRHGGFCFELNMVFEKLLLSLGFEARACLSRSVRGPEGADAINHRAELVKVGETWHFADVGFGGP
ncbi:MAG: arylamine N-acetyltransferase, partial [Coriobacteriales bacterium]